MKIHAKFLKLFVFSCCFLGFSLASCSREPPATSKPLPNTYTLPVVEVKMEKIPFPYITTGSVVSDDRIKLSSRITGFVKRITVREGERVREGQLLVILDDADVEGAIRQARAAVAKAEAKFKDAETDAKRFEALFSRGSTSDNALRKERLQRDTAEDSLCEAQAALQIALAQRDYIRMISPVDGVVIARQKRKGDLATPGYPILTVESTQSLLFETYVAEAHVKHINSENSVKVKIDALEEPIEGKITRIVRSGDPVTRRYQVKIALPEVVGLLPGMFGRAHFTIGRERTLVIPSSALVCRGGLGGVFVLDDEDRARFRWLRTGLEWPDRLAVKAGLREGDRIVAVEHPALRDGDVVKVITDG